MTDINRKFTKQVSRERQKETAEHFTPDSITDKMISCVDSIKENQTFLDPCCGDGNILEKVLQIKLNKGFNPTKSLQSLYGVELMEDNTEACRQRLLSMVGNTKKHRDIVNNNIVCADALTYDYSFGNKESIENIFF
jgi:type I restriction-modification system DNA methylase subunit